MVESGNSGRYFLQTGTSVCAKYRLTFFKSGHCLNELATTLWLFIRRDLSTVYKRLVEVQVGPCSKRKPATTQEILNTVEVGLGLFSVHEAQVGNFLRDSATGENRAGLQCPKKGVTHKATSQPFFRD